MSGSELNSGASKQNRVGGEPLQRVNNHPLQHENYSPFVESCSSTSVTYASYESSSVQTISLIQVAAKSVLDSSPGTSCHYSDDEECTNGCYEEYKSCKEQEGPDSPSLRSLQREVMSPMPEEQDRKRFVGCLAAVLASRYSYDSEIEPVQQYDDDSTYRLDMNEHDCTQDDDESDEIEDSRQPLHPPSVGSGTLYDPDAVFEQPSCVNCGADFLQESINDSPLKATQERIFRAANRKSDYKSVYRHRKRRYDVLSKLLLQSAELMQLENNHAKCFLPMLTNVLTPTVTRKRMRQSVPKDGNSRFQENETSPENLDRKASFERSSGRSEIDCSILEQKISEVEHIRPFLESLMPGAGIRCLTMFLIQQLLHSETGYDARMRHSVKTLGVLLIMHDMEDNPEEYTSSRSRYLADTEFSSSMAVQKQMPRHQPDLCTKAARVFESLENAIATHLIRLSREQAQSNQRYRKHNMGTCDTAGVVSNTLTRQSRTFTSTNFLRGLKIGGTAVAAGALFAVTGGLAAPGIAAGVAAIAGGTAITAAAAAILTSTIAVTAIFGVGGGGLAAYKMQRRTVGLTEFEFVKESFNRSKLAEDAPDAELFSTVCISGWLRDECDFQRPWGVAPSRPRIKDRQELLERFYAIHSPDHVAKSAKILASWKGEEKQLWKILRHKYGCDPNHLFPLDDGSRYRNSLSLEQHEMVGRLFIELGYSVTDPVNRTQRTPFERMLLGQKLNYQQQHTEIIDQSRNGHYLDRTENRFSFDDSLHGPHLAEALQEESTRISESTGDFFSSAPSEGSENMLEREPSSKMPKHLATVWDYQSTYGGEFYTVRWETDLLTELCDSVADLAFDVVSGGTAHLLKFTALSTLVSAMAWPYALINAANMIDSTWTLAVERADAAGKELARSLLFSTAGSRPVTLVGFSFGARAIYSCLKELARYQEKWEDFRERSSDVVLIAAHRRVGEFKEGSDAFYQHMREPASIVEDVVLMGLPNHLSITSWKACRQITSGRIVHCFSQRDLILSLMFQIKKFGLKRVCGTCPVPVAGVENVDVTDLISGHQDYCLHAGTILKRVRHCEPFQSRAPSYMESDFNADLVVREFAKLDLK